MNFTLTAAKAKVQAKSLAAYLATINRKVSHGNALEAVAQMFGAKSWNVLAAQLDDVVVDVPADVKEGRQAMYYLKDGERVAAYVGAEMHSDDHRAQATFDAAPWLLRASDEEILALAKIGWRGDYAADDVALGSRASVAEIETAFNYIDATNAVKNMFEDDIGFEVSVEEAPALLFLRAFRYPVYVQLALKVVFGGGDNAEKLGYFVQKGEDNQFQAYSEHEALTTSFLTSNEAWAALGKKLEQDDAVTQNCSNLTEHKAVLLESGTTTAVPAKAEANKKVLGRDDTETGGVLVLKPDEAHLTPEALKAITNDCEFRLKVAVPVLISSLIDNDIDGLNDLVSEAITGSVCDLTDLNFERYSPENESALIKMADVVFVLVSANWEPMDGVTDSTD